MAQQGQGSNKAAEVRESLSELDISFIRVLEDLIEVLLANGVIRLTDLPPEALEKLNQRKRVRQRMRDSLDLIDDDENSII
ncbi:hypothetical protein [Paracandidimonas soli]|uniref:Tryptophan synthase subunit beta like protein n=1 Tax=Paracandidimonas soli TaxID=1917182 RepID=A0A4V6P2L0_9BURK|nr:hypothetical protein [Paracandidimonas soli]TCU93869.1 hypothetical protein EV686_11034 [Paracandidimonas soli]